LHCVFPSPETITSGAYPLARQLRITVSREGLRRGEIRTFLDTYLRNAQRLAKKVDLVPLSDGQVTRARAQARGDARIDDAQAGG
jgi:ABC-type phosphate transport system substrate-binding protein